MKAIDSHAVGVFEDEHFPIALRAFYRTYGDEFGAGLLPAMGRQGESNYANIDHALADALTPGDPEVERADAKRIETLLRAVTKLSERMAKENHQIRWLQTRILELQDRVRMVEQENARLKLEARLLEERKENTLYWALQDPGHWDLLERLGVGGLDFAMMPNLKPVELEVLIRLSAVGGLYSAGSRIFLQSDLKSLLESVCSRLSTKLADPDQ